MAQLINNATPGYYNSRLGDLHSSNPSGYFLGPNGTTGDSRTVFNVPPNLSAIAPLGNWLSSPQTALTNSYWGSNRRVPQAWGINTETAIMFELDGGQYGISNLIGNFGADNGLFVWVNGQYKFGATAPGGAFPSEYPNVNLGQLNPGQNWIQILRTDHGGRTGSYISVVGDYNISQVPESSSAIALAVFGILCSLKYILKEI